MVVLSSILFLLKHFPIMGVVCYSHKVGKERLRMAESAGLHRKTVTGQEVAEDTDKERKLLQLQSCEVHILCLSYVSCSHLAVP